jgi:hypothetical protein
VRAGSVILPRLSRVFPDCRSRLHAARIGATVRVPHVSAAPAGTIASARCLPGSPPAAGLQPGRRTPGSQGISRHGCGISPDGGPFVIVVQFAATKPRYDTRTPRALCRSAARHCGRGHPVRGPIDRQGHLRWQPPPGTLPLHSPRGRLSSMAATWFEPIGYSRPARAAPRGERTL